MLPNDTWAQLSVPKCCRRCSARLRKVSKCGFETFLRVAGSNFCKSRGYPCSHVFLQGLLRVLATGSKEVSSYEVSRVGQQSLHLISRIKIGDLD